MSKEVKPIVLKNTENGEVFTLEFNRESVKYAEKNGFKTNTESISMGMVEDLFFYAFRMHHRLVNREKAMKILYEDLGGLSEAFIERLGELYAIPYDSLFSEEEVKNSKVVVEL